MRRKTYVVLALVLVFALIFVGCTVRRPMSPVQPRQNTTGLYNNRTGVGANTGYGTNRYGTNTGYGPNYGYATNYGYGPNAGYGPNSGFGTNTGYYGTNTGIGTNYGYGTNYGTGGTNNSPNYNLNGIGPITTQADNIARAVETVPGVNNATVVISGNTAYVGVDLNKGTPTANVSTIKSQCAQRVRSTNPDIGTVYVSTDPDFLTRIRRVSDAVRAGRPVSGFRTELTDLVRRLTPERR
ncbi:MAG: YhcN/YlaJ family sporulation lipoprotein [Caulobacteraceae bacterium]